MQDLVKLLFSNFYVVIIIVGFLLTMLNKTRGKQNGDRPMPPFGGGTMGRTGPGTPAQRPNQPERSQHRPASSQAFQRADGRRGESAASDSGGPIGGGVYTSQFEPAAASTSPERPDLGLTARKLEAELLAASRSKKSDSRASVPRNTGSAATFRVPKGNELRQAVIMAEILGPPRSKRPHRSK